MALHRYAGRIFAPDEHEMALQRAATRRSLHAALSQYSGTDPTDEVTAGAVSCTAVMQRVASPIAAYVPDTCM